MLKMTANTKKPHVMFKECLQTKRNAVFGMKSD